VKSWSCRLQTGRFECHCHQARRSSDPTACSALCAKCVAVHPFILVKFAAFRVARTYPVPIGSLLLPLSGPGRAICSRVGVLDSRRLSQFPSDTRRNFCPIVAPQQCSSSAALAFQRGGRSTREFRPPADQSFPQSRIFQWPPRGNTGALVVLLPNTERRVRENGRSESGVAFNPVRSPETCASEQ